MWPTLPFVALLLVAGDSTRQAPVVTVTPPEALVVRGMPPVPASIADAMAPYSDSRRAVFRSWHPVRREMLISTRFGDSEQIHRVRMPGGARTQVTFVRGGLGGGQRPPAPASYQQASGDYLVYSKDVDGDEAFQTYRLDLETGASVRVTDGASRNTLGVWSHRGDRLAYMSTRRNGKDFDLYVVDPATPSTDRLVSRLDGTWDAIGWSGDDRAVLTMQLISVSESSLWSIDVVTGEKTRLTPPERGPVSYAGGVLSRDGRYLYLTTDRNSDFLRLARLDLRAGTMVPMTESVNGDVEEFALSPDGELMAFVTNEDGVGRLRLLETATGRERSVPPMSPGIVSNIVWHRNGVDLAFDVQSPRSPGDVHSLNVSTGRVDRWTFSETGGLNPESLAEPEVVHWKSFDGLTISGILYRPPTRFTGARPVMINIHGGPERGQARPSWIGRSNYFLNELGVAIIYPNVRGSSGFGKQFRELDNGVLRENATKDLGALLDWIETRPDLDAGRVMVTGASYGGYLTLATAVAYNDQIRCAFAGFPVSNMVTDLEQIDPSRRDGRRAEYGDERDPTIRAVLERIAPVNNAARITKPLFLAHGQNDPRVPVSQTDQMAAAVEKNGTPLWYLVAKNEGHGFANRANGDFLMHAWAFFMQQFLLE